MKPRPKDLPVRPSVLRSRRIDPGIARTTPRRTFLSVGRPVKPSASERRVGPARRTFLPVPTPVKPSASSESERRIDPGIADKGPARKTSRPSRLPVKPSASEGRIDRPSRRP